MRLADLQELFWDTMRAPAPGSTALSGRVRGNARLSSVARVGVYHFAYWERQERVLFDEFRRLSERLGVERFRRLVHAYLRERPSREPRIEGLGRELPAFLRRCAEPELAACAELAAFEWAETEVLIEGDPAHTATGFGVAPEAVPACRLRFVAALRMLAVKGERLADMIPGLSGPAATSSVAIWRPGFHLRYRAVDTDEHAAFEVARDGRLMAEICQTFETADAPDVRAATVLGGWFRSGWIADVVPPEKDDQ